MSGKENKEQAGNENISNGSVCDACRRGAVCACRKISARWASLRPVEKWTLPFAVSILLIGLCVYLFSFSEWTVSSGRVLDANLPWVGNRVTISDATGEWRASEEDARMVLRSAYYPRVKIVAKAGSGALLVRFKNSRGHYVGDPVSLKIKDGKFIQTADINAVTEGNSAVVRCEVGFSSKNDYRAHVFMGDEALWTAVVYEKNDDGRIMGKPLGVFSIQP